MGGGGRAGWVCAAGSRLCLHQLSVPARPQPSAPNSHADAHIPLAAAPTPAGELQPQQGRAPGAAHNRQGGAGGWLCSAWHRIAQPAAFKASCTPRPSTHLTCPSRAELRAGPHGGRLDGHATRMRSGGGRAGGGAGGARACVPGRGGWVARSEKRPAAVHAPLTHPLPHHTPEPRPRPPQRRARAPPLPASWPALAPALPRHTEAPRCVSPSPPSCFCSCSSSSLLSCCNVSAAQACHRYEGSGRRAGAMPSTQRWRVLAAARGCATLSSEPLASLKCSLHCIISVEQCEVAVRGALQVAGTGAARRRGGAARPEHLRLPSP